MAFGESRGVMVPVQLPNGAIIKVEVASTGQENVAFKAKQFQPVVDAIEGVVQMIAAPLEKAKPKKATVKFGMELALESGELTGVLVKGSGKGSLEITLEWETLTKE